MFKTNIQRQKGTRRKPQVGDVFGMRLPTKGWLFGRVVRADANGSGGGPGDVTRGEMLIYIYENLEQEPRPIPRLDRNRLLIAPLIINTRPWSGGWFVTLESGEPKPGDVLERHCFEDWVHGGFVDEYQRRLKGRFEPCGETGLASIKLVDDLISERLGLRVIPDGEQEDEPPESAKRPPRKHTGSGGVSVYLPTKRAGKARVERIEERLREAVEKANAGVWEGHGFDLTRNVFDTRFESRSVTKLIDALGAALTQLRDQLPDGWYATVRRGDDGEEDRIELEPKASR